MIAAVPTSPSMLSVQTSKSPLDRLRAGDVVEARVDTVLKDGLVRLIVGDATLEVRAPVELAPGEVVKLAVKRDADGNLVFELKRHMPMLPAPAAGPTPHTGGVPGKALLSLLIGIGASIATARSRMQSEWPAEPMATGQALEETNHQAIGSAVGRYATVNLELFSEPDIQSQPQVTGEASSDADTAEAAPAPAFSRNQMPTTLIGSSVISTAVIAIMVPETAERFRIMVSCEDDEHRSKQPSDEPTKSFTARFTLELDILGPVHAVLRQRGDAVSVGLWAERPEALAELRRDRADLRAALSQAAVVIEALDVQGGRPASSAGSTLSMELAHS